MAQEGSASDRANQIAMSIPPARRESFVREVLSASIAGLEVPPDLQRLTDSDIEFTEAAAIFRRLRPSTLTAEAEGVDRTRTIVLLAGENAAKVLADPWGERFDPDSVGWFWLCVLDLLAARGDDRVTSAVVPMLEAATASGDVPGH